jgi:hypothetical protein
VVCVDGATSAPGSIGGVEGRKRASKGILGPADVVNVYARGSLEPMSSPWIVPRTPSGPATANRLLIIVENASLRSTLRPKSSFDCLFIFFLLSPGRITLVILFVIDLFISLRTLLRGWISHPNLRPDDFSQPSHSIKFLCQAAQRFLPSSAATGSIALHLFFASQV